MASDIKWDEVTEISLRPGHRAVVIELWGSNPDESAYGDRHDLLDLLEEALEAWLPDEQEEARRG